MNTTEKPGKRRRVKGRINPEDLSTPHIDIPKILKDNSITLEWPSGDANALVLFKQNLEAINYLFKEVLKKCTSVADFHPFYASSLWKKCVDEVEKLIEIIYQRNGDLQINDEESHLGSSPEEIVQLILQVLSGALAELEAETVSNIFNQIDQLKLTILEGEQYPILNGQSDTKSEPL